MKPKVEIDFELKKMLDDYFNSQLDKELGLSVIDSKIRLDELEIVKKMCFDSLKKEIKKKQFMFGSSSQRLALCCICGKVLVKISSYSVVEKFKNGANFNSRTVYNCHPTCFKKLLRDKLEQKVTP